MKVRLVFLFGLTLSSVFSQTLTTEYFDNKGNVSAPKESYYFKTGTKNKQGRFYDSLKSYYARSKKIRSIEILDRFGNPIGNYESFYPNGILQLKGRYEKKNFKLFQSSPDSTEFSIEQFNDSSGNAQVKSWNGFVHGRMMFYLEKGKVVNGLRDSVWTTYDDNGRIQCHESWHDGELIDGISYDEEGKEYYYKAFLTLPEPSEGDKKFYDRLSDEVQYPKDAQRRGIEGKIIVTFVVEKNGSIAHPQIEKGIGFGCDEEALRVISLSRHWKPALQRGQPIQYPMTIPFQFKLK